MADIILPNPEYLGRKRFPDNKGYRQDLYQKSSDILSVLLNFLASNYPEDPESTNIGILTRSACREFARMIMDAEAVNSDKVYTGTRIQFLQQILGERLFLNDKIVPPNYTDEFYRKYLISIKDAFLRGSSKESIEELLSQFINLPINLRELYLEARKPDSSYSVVDTHKMIVEVFVDDQASTSRNISEILTDLTFFVNLARPAHVLYDTNLIWTDKFDVNKIHDLEYGDTGGGCVPRYIFTPFSEPVILAFSVLVQDTGTGATGQVGSVHHEDLCFFISNGTRVIVEPGVNGTGIFNSRGKRILIDDLKPGDWVKITSVNVPGRFQFLWTPPYIDPSGYEQFYRANYTRPIIQEFVRKVMDSHERFPLQTKATPTTICDKWVQDALQPLYEDMRSYCKTGSDSSSEYSITLQEKMWSPRFSVRNLRPNDRNSVYLGSNYWFSLPNTPVTDGSGGPANPADIHTFYDGTSLTGAVLSVDTSTGNTILNDSTSYWDSVIGNSPVLGNVLEFQYKYLLDGTDTTSTDRLIFGISHWQLPKTPVVSSGGTLAGPSDIKVYLDGTYIPDAVSSIRPILGHVSLDDKSSFWSASLGRIPSIGNEIEFEFSYGSHWSYTIITDSYERTLDTPLNGIGFVLDGSDSSSAVDKNVEPVVMGYRYRAYLLHHSSVLNSPDTLLLNNYQKPANRASLINQQHSLNHINIFYSPEFLYDKSSNIVLNDKYLENGLDPILKLNEGTPTFQETFSYHPGLVYERKLQDIRQHRHPLMYSDLLLKEYDSDGEDINLSSICDSDNISFKIRIPDEIPPIRECLPWIFLDSINKELYDVYIPGERIGVSNLRVASKHLRDNFILRETEDIGVIWSYWNTRTPVDSRQTIFQLPDTTHISDPNVGHVNFPSLPVMKDKSNMADPSDVSVFIDGTYVPSAVMNLSPVTGAVELYDLPDYPKFDSYVLTNIEINAGELYMSSYPADATSVVMSVTDASSVDSTKIYGTDYYVIGQALCWRGGSLDGSMAVDSTVKLAYMKDMLINTAVEFKYRILNFREVELVDSTTSKVLDNGYVLGGPCPDPFPVVSDSSFEEYYGFLSDYSDGIKIKYFNKSTRNIEEHVFSGPVFEMYEPLLDEYGSTESFPEARIRVPNPIHSGNPFKSGRSYEFIGDYMARFKKKTFKELLPDRTFRTIKVTEMEPV